MDPMKLYEKFEKMREELGTETLLNELYDAMTTDEAGSEFKIYSAELEP